MYQGNWTCSKCGGTITELPFEPKSDKGLTCRECYFKEKNGSTVPAANNSPSKTVDQSADMDDREAPPFDPDAAELANEPTPDSPDREAAPATTGGRKMFQGDWKCAGCGATISQLPFQPRGDASNLKCLECFKQSRN